MTSGLGSVVATSSRNAMSVTSSIGAKTKKGIGSSFQKLAIGYIIAEEALLLRHNDPALIPVHRGMMPGRD